MALRSTAAAATPPFNLFPQPKEVVWLQQQPEPLASSKVAIVIGDRASEPEQYAAETLQKTVARRYGVTWPVVRDSASLARYSTLLVLGQRKTCRLLDRLCKEWALQLSDKSPGHDGYVIFSRKRKTQTIVVVGGSNPRGVVYGQDTLFQLLQKKGTRLVLHRAKIRDWPSIPWRGRPHSDIAGYDRPHTFDDFAQARVNFIDLRCGSRIYGTPPGFKLDHAKLSEIVKQAHRRGFFVYATVDCAVPKEQYDAVIKTFEEYIALGADGLYMSIDDPGADFRIGTSSELVTRVVALGRRHGMTGPKLAMVPGKESYKEIATATNRKVAKIPGMDEALLFFTVTPSAENLKKAQETGYKSKPAWWHNWPRPRGGFNHSGNLSHRVNRDQPYMELPAMSEGWNQPSWQELHDAGDYISAVMPWGGSVWDAHETICVMGWWAWAPELHDWHAHRARLYDWIFGTELVQTAFEFDDTLVSLKNLFVLDPDYPGQGQAGGLAVWPPRLKDVASRPQARALIAQLERLLEQLERGAAKGTLLEPEMLSKYYLEPMRVTLTTAKVMTDLDYPEYWWPSHEHRVLTAVKAGDLEQARQWELEGQARALQESRHVEEVLSPMVTVEGYAKSWAARFVPTGEARHIDRPVRLTGDLSDPLWATAPKLGGFADGSDIPEDPTEVQLLYTDDALYLGFTCHESQMDKLVVRQTARDSNVWDDDSVEIFLNPDGLLTPYYQFVTNANGVMYDERQLLGAEADASWNADWEVKTARDTDRWTAEIRIPLKSIGVEHSPQGSIWMCNFARNDRSVKGKDVGGVPVFTTSSYGAEPRGGLHNTAKFRPILFR